MNLETLKSKLLKIDEVPSGWRTAVQWSAYWKVSTAQTSRLLTQALNSKLARRKTFRVAFESGVRNVPHYKFKEVA